MERANVFIKTVQRLKYSIGGSLFMQYLRNLKLSIRIICGFVGDLEILHSTKFTLATKRVVRKNAPLILYANLLIIAIKTQKKLSVI